jgi:hypothetical protein
MKVRQIGQSLGEPRFDQSSLLLQLILTFMMGWYIPSSIAS